MISVVISMVKSKTLKFFLTLQAEMDCCMVKTISNGLLIPEIFYSMVVLTFILETGLKCRLKQNKM